MEERIDLLLARKISGEATEAELQELQQWLKDHPEDGFVMEVVNATQSVPPANSGEWAGNSWAALEAAMNAPETAPEATPADTLPPTGKVTRFFPRWMIAAAVLAAVVIAATFIFRPSPIKNNIPHPESNTIVMRKGARSSVQLPDGTTVWLNSSSRLSYGDGFAHGKREVFLQGEAFFTVSQQEQQPFIVHAGNMTVQVLGTTFNVKAYTEDQQLELVLLSGKVAVATTRQPEPLQLVPGQKVTAWSATAPDSLQQQPMTVAAFANGNSCDETAWIHNQLIFKNKTFAALSKEMERWYNVNIHIQDASLEKELFNGVFQKENVTEALKALQIATPFTFYQSGSEIYIKKAG
ncbi:MAG: FecR domain-containing protein [Chitinophaga sp.]|uniref:FecR family protein n=1 Tax=Chitinophaga sp. TaxID=1869181 RepID=UPI001B1EA868|nr:FecR domain-containing protein [Chitinophaga sp.]MBO9732144.1 FecR domain-containing protein [Chitinophaga sp.]